MLHWSQMRPEDFKRETAPMFDMPRSTAARELAEPGTLFEQAPQPVYVIPCSGAKLDHPAPARELYTGPMFRYALAAAESTGARVLVLSARHGLVELDAELAPYDERMAPHKVTRLAATVRVQAAGLIEPGADVTALVPADYFRALQMALSETGRTLTNAYQGCRGIGDQRAVLAGILAASYPPAEPDRNPLDPPQEVLDRMAARGLVELTEPAPTLARCPRCQRLACGFCFEIHCDCPIQPEPEPVRCWCCAQHQIRRDAALGRSTCVGCAMRSPSACARKHAAEQLDRCSLCGVCDDGPMIVLGAGVTRTVHCEGACRG